MLAANTPCSNLLPESTPANVCNAASAAGVSMTSSADSVQRTNPQPADDVEPIMSTNTASPGPGAGERRAGQDFSAALTARNVREIARLERSERERLTLGERIAETIGRFCGSLWFVWLHFAWFSAWLAWNGLPLAEVPFDPPPFDMLGLTVALEAVLLSAFILISQNRETRIADRRNHLDLQINLLAEQETTHTLRLLRAICEKFDIPVDESGRHLERDVDPVEVVDLIDQDLPR